MTEELANSAQDNAPIFQIQRVYLKDISLEQPNAPEILLAQAEPKLEVQGENYLECLHNRTN